jgi:hypothetical protein
LLKAAEHVLAVIEIKTNAAEDVAGARAASVAARQIAFLTANPAYANDDEKYKVWPTNDDRVAFRQVMDAIGSGRSRLNPVPDGRSIPVSQHVDPQLGWRKRAIWRAGDRLA